MLFWIGIIIALGFAYSAIKLGFYQAWTLLFNTIIGIYLGIRLGPMVQQYLPISDQYNMTLSMLATGLGTFLILQAISYVFLIGQFEVTFPKVVNMAGSAIFGFITGLLFWSFGVFLFCTTPFCEKPVIKEAGFGAVQFEQAKMQSYLGWWCKFVDTLVASPRRDNADKVIKDLLEGTAKKNTQIISQQPIRADANEPNEPNLPKTIVPARRQIELPP
jgi:hypothetical protein